MNRRQFLKLSSLVSFLSLPLHVQPPRLPISNPDARNILIVVFDAFSAKNIPFYGYPRNTTPNLNKLLDKAIVYHNHYAAGNYTTPGTASLLTGTYPWTHRAINLGDQVIPKLLQNNIFNLLDDYYRICYTHNTYANIFLQQFIKDIQHYQNPESLYLTKHWLSEIINKDLDIAKLSALRILEQDRYSGNSLFIKRFSSSGIYQQMVTRNQQELLNKYEPLFPNTLPRARELDQTFDAITIEQAIDWLVLQLNSTPQPFLTYFHLLPPHAPYRTRVDFDGSFSGDGFSMPHKPTHVLLEGFDKNRAEKYVQALQQYDEFILYVDSEFKRLYDQLQSSGLLHNTIVILTSDHGEMFERGYHFHNHETLHQPVIQVPLVIFDPDIPQRVDIHQQTSAVDILPTLAALNDLPFPQFTVGQVLPPYSKETSTQDIFALQAEGNSPKHRIKAASAMIVREDLKLTYYFGYPALRDNDPYIELYNIADDPEEMENLYHPNDIRVKEMLESLLSKMEKSEKLYT